MLLCVSDCAPGPLAAHHILDVATNEADIGERAIIEPLERAHVTPQAPLGGQIARQPLAFASKPADACRKFAQRVTQKCAHEQAAIAVRAELEFVG
jgi:hypothetical protein